MLRHFIENNSKENDEVELSRRGFFGRFAVGAVLSIAMPGVVNAAKKADKNQRIAKKAKTSGVRLPKHKAKTTTKVVHHSSKVKSVKSSKTGKASKALAAKKHKLTHAKHTRNSTRVHSVIAGKRQHGGSGLHYADKADSIIQPEQKSIFVANHGHSGAHRALAIQNPHTGDKLSLTYFERGRYVNDALEEISFLLRDYRTDDVHPIDPELLDQLYDLKQMLGLHQPFDVISGYRSPLTNAKLHAERAGVANNSFHMYGRAVDIRIERFDLRRIHNAALAMHRGGVGYYPGSKFIHLDTGTFRTWSL